MKTALSRQILTTLLLLLALGAFRIQAQNTPASVPSPLETVIDRNWELNIVNGSLQPQKGKPVPATLSNVIGYLRDMYPANVVLAPGVGQIKVSDLKLASFQWEQALEALRVASGNGFMWNTRPEKTASIDPNTGLPIAKQGPPAGGAESDLLVLTLDETGAGSGPRRVVEVFNLGGYLRGMDEKKVESNLDQIQRIVAETVDALQKGRPDSGSRLHFQFHSGATLLIVIGSPEEVEIARKVVLALPEASASKATYGGMEDEARKSFMQRYGLSPGQMPGGWPAPHTPGSPAAQPPAQPGPPRTTF